MRRILLLTVALAGCAHHPLSCAIGLPYDDCLAGTSGAEAYASGKRVDPYAEMMVLNYAAGVQSAAWAAQQYNSTVLMQSLSAPRYYSPPVTYYVPR